MPTIPLLAPQSAAATLTEFDSSAYQYVAFAAGTMTTDTVTVKVKLPDGQTSQAGAPDINGVLTGLAAANPVRWYPGGPAYVLAKVGTTDTIGIYAIVGGRVL